MTRQVILLSGPPAAGKTTIARASGLDVYDRDDDHWPSGRTFRAALDELAYDYDAQAVVIWTGATSARRHTGATLVGATHTYLVRPSLDECKQRAITRDRDNLLGELAGITRWFREFDHDDNAPDFPGWDAHQDGAYPTVQQPQRQPLIQLGDRWVTPNQLRSTHAWQQASRAVCVPGSSCWICGRLLRFDVHHNDPAAPTADHVIAIVNGGHPFDPANLRPACRSCNSRKGARTTTDVIEYTDPEWL